MQMSTPLVPDGGGYRWKAGDGARNAPWYMVGRPSVILGLEVKSGRQDKTRRVA